MTTKPFALTSDEWAEIMRLDTVREAWGLEPGDTAEDFAQLVYAAKFHFVSGSPGYVGDLFILQGDHLTGDPPFVLKRDANGKLAII